MKKCSLILLIFFVLVIAENIYAASFDCRKARSEVERIICGNAELSTLDESLKEAYLQALKRTDIKRKTKVSQRQWLKNERNVCRNVECIKNAYEKRIQELGLLSSYGIIIFRPKQNTPTPMVPATSPKPEVTEHLMKIDQPQTKEPRPATNSIDDTSIIKISGNLSPDGKVSIFAGSKNLPGSRNGLSTKARFNYPFGITTDDKNLYVSEITNQTIRKIEIATGRVRTLAGRPGKREATDGVGKAARFRYPHGMATDGTNLYVADVGNHIIRKIVIATRRVTTLAGTVGRPGYADGKGSSAQFASPHDIVIVGKNLYVTESTNDTIRKIVIATGDVTTFAGTARACGFADGIDKTARFCAPEGITTDGVNLYIADSLNNTIRKIVIATGEVTTLAGPDNDICAREGWHGKCPGGSRDGLGSVARLNSPCFLTTDGVNLYVTERHRVVRKILISSGEVTTLSGTSRESGSTVGIMGITNDGKYLYVTDVLGHTILKIQ